MLKHVCACCRHTRGRFEPTHGDVLNLHTERREVLLSLSRPFSPPLFLSSLLLSFFRRSLPSFSSFVLFLRSLSRSLSLSQFYKYLSLFSPKLVLAGRSHVARSPLAALQDSLGKSAHSELALFALYWPVVTFPCGIVHILVMIRLRVVYGGRRVGQVLPSYQNRQKSALDETADVPQSSLFSLLSSLCVHTALTCESFGPFPVWRTCSHYARNNCHGIAVQASCHLE